MNRALPEWAVVARREFLERVRTVWFIVVTVLGPIGMAAIIVVPAWLSVESAKKEVKIQLLDHTGKELSGFINEAIADEEANLVIETIDPQTSKAILQERIRTEQIDGFLVIPEGALAGQPAVYRGVNATSQMLTISLTRVINRAVYRVRAQEANIPLDEFAKLIMPVMVETRQDTGTSEATSGTASFIVGYTVMFILYMSILLYAVNVLRSVVQEKTSRVVDSCCESRHSTDSAVMSSLRSRSISQPSAVGQRRAT